MRVLACYHPREFMSPEAAKDHDDLRLIGWAPGENSRHVLAMIDPIDDGAPVEVRRHPRLLMLEDPALWRVVDRFSTGARRKLRPGDYERLSAWETVATLAMISARSRERVRELKRMSERIGVDDGARK